MRVKSLFVLLSTVTMLCMPAVSSAQGIGGFLKKVGKALDEVSKQAAANPGLAGPPVVTGAAVPDTFTQKLQVSVIPAPGPCGTARACVPGFDLRAVRVMLPAQAFAVDQNTVATVEIENRGRSASPPSELVVKRQYSNDQGGRYDVPSVPAGGKVIMRTPYRMGTEERDEYSVVAQIDPDNATGEVNRDNNEIMSAPVRVELPAFEWLTVAAPSPVSSGSRIPLHIVIRNASRAANTPATDLTFGTYSSCSGLTYLTASTTRVDVPPLAPHGTFDVTMLVPTGTCSNQSVRYDAQIDVKNADTWSSRNRNAGSADVNIR